MVMNQWKRELEGEIGGERREEKTEADFSFASERKRICKAILSFGRYMEDRMTLAETQKIDPTLQVIFYLIF